MLAVLCPRIVPIASRLTPTIAKKEAAECDQTPAIGPLQS